MAITTSDSLPRLVGDIGGTNARFALVHGPQGLPQQVEMFACADFAGPREVIERYLEGRGEGRPRWAAIGIATPIDGDQVRMTNHDWAFSIEALRRELELERLVFLNDFTALALSIPVLAPQERRQVGGGKVVEGRAIGVVGPGTGLGVSGLLPNRERWIPLEGEGGHITLAASNAHEAELIAYLAARYAHVSAERFLSGPGLVALHAANAAIRGEVAKTLDPGEITRYALSGESELCVVALNDFCALLGTVAADVALILGARGGLYIGGGIVPRLGSFFDASPFRARFEHKGRFSDYLARVPTFVIDAPWPALMGAARSLEG
jgi:glucokinase